MSVFGIVIYTTYAFWLRHRIALKYVLIEHVLLPSLYWYGHSQNSQASGAELGVFIRMCSFLYGFDLQFFSLWVTVEKMTRIFDKLLFVGKGKKVYLSQSIVIEKKKKNNQVLVQMRPVCIQGTFQKAQYVTLIERSTKGRRCVPQLPFTVADLIQQPWVPV